VTDVAMESTGQYWRPLWNVLEGEFAQLILVNPQHIKGLNGYKTDPKDALWIAGLLEGGKLRNSWVPPRRIRLREHSLRDLVDRVHLDAPAADGAKRAPRAPPEQPHEVVDLGRGGDCGSRIAQRSSAGWRWRARCRRSRIVVTLSGLCPV
jgi:hypothetical protein